MTGIVIPDGGTIGSASDTDALTITNTGVVKASQSIATSTIKDATGTNNSISIATNGDATFAENIKITNGKGIDFSAVGSSASGSSSAVLDDYEEGSVIITSATPGTSGSITLNSGRNTLFYTKIGRVVTLSGMLQVSSFSSPVGDTVTLSPLPFTAASNVSGFEGRTGNAMPWRPSGTAGVPEYASGQISEGGSTLVMYTDASTWSASNAQLVVNVTYVVS